MDGVVLTRQGVTGQQLLTDYYYCKVYRMQTLVALNVQAMSYHLLVYR
jgi:hypothetical protein